MRYGGAFPPRPRPDSAASVFAACVSLSPSSPPFVIRDGGALELSLFSDCINHIATKNHSHYCHNTLHSTQAVAVKGYRIERRVCGAATGECDDSIAWQKMPRDGGKSPQKPMAFEVCAPGSRSTIKQLLAEQLGSVSCLGN